MTATSVLTTTQRALELVAVRGKDVVGVRHLVDGGRATMGAGADAIVRLADTDAPFTVATVRGDDFVLRVPAKARARVHGADGIPRLVAGPADVRLAEGERAVLYVGEHQLRARVAQIETLARGVAASAKAIRWIAIVGAVYVAALGLCATLVPSHAPQLTAGFGRAIQATALTIR